MHEFLDILKEKFLSKQSNQFVLYGNVKDTYLIDGSYVPLIEYLNRSFQNSNRLQIHFNISSGITFFSKTDRDIIKAAYKRADFLGGTEVTRERWFNKALDESAIYPQLAVKFLNECIKLKLLDKEKKVRQFSIIVDYLETIAPASPLDKLNDSDRQKIVTLLEWLSSPSFADSPNLVVFFCDTVNSINENIITLPSITCIEIPRPTFDERLEFIRHQQRELDSKVKLKFPQKKLSHLTAGLSLKSIHHLFLSANYLDEKLDEKGVISKTNEIIRKELGDIIEITTPDHGLKAVIGAHKLKKHLKNLIQLIKADNPSIAPVGILASGPNGVGKTFIFEAFAKEVGFNIIKFKQIRSQWFGQTDVIFEKIKSILTSIGKVIVLIDEADTAFGGRSGATHETEKRLFGNLIQMMGDPQNRGKIIWVLITARPDKLEPDIKRSGRAGIHLPVFDPEGDERTNFIEWVFSKIGENFKQSSSSFKQTFLEVTSNYSAADFNELMVLIKSQKALNKNILNKKEILNLTKDFVPANLSLERRYQTLVAASECSFRSVLPEHLKDLNAIRAEVDILKKKLNY